ncbi:MAG: hypothetical protein WC373_16865 [Smithella sp.]|jgi:cell shape-determining protein MreC
MKRYDIWIENGSMKESENGSIVYFSDVSPVLAENEELKKKLKECEQKIEELEYRYARGAGGGLSGQ